MGRGEATAGVGGSVGAAFREAFGGFSETLPTDLLFRWQRLQFCATFGWTFTEYDAQDVRAMGEAAIIMEKARAYNVPLRMG